MSDPIRSISQNNYLLATQQGGGGGGSYTAGDGIDITSDTISVKVDNSTIGLNASGQLESIGGGGISQVNSDWDATSGVAEILNKPDTEEVEFEELDLSGYVTSADLPDLSTYATQTWSTNSFFPIDGIQIVGSSAEASGANIIYIVSGSNA